MTPWSLGRSSLLNIFRILPILFQKLAKAWLKLWQHYLNNNNIIGVRSDMLKYSVEFASSYVHVCFTLCSGYGMSQATLGFFRATHTHAHGNPYPQPWAQVLLGAGCGFYKTLGFSFFFFVPILL